MDVRSFHEGAGARQFWIYNDQRSITLSPAEAADVAQKLIAELERIGYCQFTEAMKEEK